MLDEQKKRLKNRIETCMNEINLAIIRIKSDNKDLQFWKHELLAAQADYHGMQLELNLRCSGCGD